MTGRQSTADLPLYSDVTIEPDVQGRPSLEDAALLATDPLAAPSSHVPATNVPTASASISSADLRHRYTGPPTLDEPILTTVLADGRAIGRRLLQVLYPPYSPPSSATPDAGADWDLWGPMVVTLVMSVAIAYRGGGERGQQSSGVFAGVFALCWAGFGACAGNVGLLGGKTHVLGGVCTMGYALAPLAAAAVLGAFFATLWVRVPVAGAACAWSIWASIRQLQTDEAVARDLQGRKALAIFPNALFYAVVAWTIVVIGR
ncbi:hypothetical protein PYCC9005_001951 [Savitreella phatthalungensis]